MKLSGLKKLLSFVFSLGPQSPHLTAYKKIIIYDILESRVPSLSSAFCSLMNLGAGNIFSLMQLSWSLGCPLCIEVIGGGRAGNQCSQEYKEMPSFLEYWSEPCSREVNTLLVSEALSLIPEPHPHLFIPQMHPEGVLAQDVVQLRLLELECIFP